MMDSVDYRREEGCNVVTLVKNTRTAEPPSSDDESVRGSAGLTEDDGEA